MPDGNTDEKAAFQLLSELENDYHLGQLIDQPTRGTAVLDLVYSDAPESFSECKMKTLKPTSDHNLLTFELNKTTIKTNQPTETPDPLPEIHRLNFKSENKDALAQALTDTD